MGIMDVCRFFLTFFFFYLLVERILYFMQLNHACKVECFNVPFNLPFGGFSPP